MAFTKLEPTGVNTSATFTLAGANITGNITVNGVSNLGPVSNIHITGGTTGQVLSTDGSGGLTWATPSAGGSNYSNANVASYLPTYTGNVSADYFIGNGSTLTHITGGNVDGQVSNALIASTIYTNAQPNITSVGTLSSVNVTGNVSSGAYLVGNGAFLTGLPASYANSNVAAYLPTYTGNFAAGNITATSNVTAAYFIGNGSQLTGVATGTPNSIVNGTSNVAISTSDGNIAASVGGNSNIVVVTSTGANVNGYLTITGALTTGGGGGGTFSGANLISANFFSGNGSLLTGITASSATTAGTVTTNAQPNITSVGTLSSVDVTGNVSSGGNIIGNGQYLSALTGGNVTGQVSNSLVAGTVYTGAQPNITSVGTLSSVSVTGLTTATGGVKTANILDVSGTVTLQTKYNSVAGDVGIVGNLVVGTGGTGNITATYLIGNGSQLTGLPASYANSNVAAYLPTYTGNFTAGNVLTDHLLYANGVAWSFGGGGGGASISNGTSNINIASSGGNITASVDGNASVVVFTGTGANVNGYLAVTGSFTAGTGTGGSISGANAISANYFVGSGTYLTGISSMSSGASNVNIASAGANVTVGVGGTPNIAVFANSGATITGNLSVSGALSAGGGSGGSITGANAITANYFTGKRYAETVVSGGTTNGTLTPDVNLGTIFQYTLNGAVTINALGNAVAGTSVTLILTQDASGSRLLTSTMKFAGASKTLTTTANAIDIMSVFYDGTTYYAALSKGYA